MGPGVSQGTGRVGATMTSLPPDPADPAGSAGSFRSAGPLFATAETEPPARRDPIDEPGGHDDGDRRGAGEDDEMGDGAGEEGGLARPDLLEGLNPVQLEAVTHVDGPLLVVAGAGSGKTRVLTHRIAHLIRNEGVSPFEILAITFTNKAADEMKQRVAALVGPVAQKMWVSTFHAACVRILRRDGKALGFPSSFTIYDQADAVRLTGYVVRDLNLDSKRFPPRSVHAAISAAKNEGLDADLLHGARPGHLRAQDRRRLPGVPGRLARAGAMDFDDLLGNAVRLFREHPDVLEHYRQRFKHVLVDEYQDTNHVQNELVLQLTSEHRNVLVVGDTDQCLPSGTMISTPAGAVPIETIAEGDVVRDRRSFGPSARDGHVREGGSLLGAVRVGPRRRSHPPRHTPSHRAGSNGERAGTLVRLPDVAGRPRLPGRTDQGHPIGQLRP